MKQKNLLSANLFFVFISIVFFGSFFVAQSTLAFFCETNTMKWGTQCNSADGNSWCNLNAASPAACTVESVASCPANPANGTYAFSCNSNSCVLSCGGSYSKCSSNNTCILTQSCSIGQTFDACSNSCTGSVATLKLAYDSAASNNLVNSASPVLTIPSSGNVGIGTMTPSVLFDVFGVGSFSQPVFVGTPTANNQAATKGYVDSQIGGGSLWTSSAAGIYNSGLGNVGIGITNPGAKLTVNANGTDDTVQEYLRLSRTGYDASYYNSIYSGTGSGHNNLQFRMSNLAGTQDTVMTLRDGNVGIGTTNPLAALDIYGKVKTTSGGIIYNTDSGRWLDMSGVLGDSLKVSGDLYSTAGNLKIAGTGNSYVMGNVGIGTTNPLTMLDIYRASAPIVTLRDTNSGFRFVPSGGINYIQSGADITVADSKADIYFTSISGVTPWMVIKTTGSVGIGTTNPGALLSLGNAENAQKLLIYDGAGYAKGGFGIQSGEFRNFFWNTAAIGYTWGTYNISTNAWSELVRITSGGSVGIGTTDPGAYKLNIAGSTYMGGGVSIVGNLAMSGSANISGINKLTVNTIDPLYNIYGTNYSSFAPSIVGGVKEEVTGKVNISVKVGNEYEAVVDFDNQEIGSDLWVWHQVIDFNKDNVEAVITPYGGFANTYYYISSNKLIFRSDRPVEISYRLLAKRFDWEKWPTKATDQIEKAGLIIK